MSHRAVCSECSWTGDASTLSSAARELDDHRQETGHDVKIERDLMTDGGQPATGVERCPGCGDTGDKLDGDDWQDQLAYFCQNSACGVVVYGDGEMPGYGGI